MASPSTRRARTHSMSMSAIPTLFALCLSQWRSEGDRASRNTSPDLPSGRWPSDPRHRLFARWQTVVCWRSAPTSNIDDPDTHPGEKNRADILVMSPDGSTCACTPMESAMPGAASRSTPRMANSGARPTSATDWATTWSPITLRHVQDGGFYGWPYYYIGRQS